jgi:hypothetical protein
MIPQIVAAAARLLSSVGRGISQGIGSAAQGAYNLRTGGGGVQQVQRVMNQLGLSAHRLKNPIQSLIEPMDQLAARSSRLSSLVRLVNPGQARQADLAVQNLMASIGKHLQPVLRGTTNLVNSFNRVISGMGSVIKPATEAFEKFLTELGKTIEEMGPDGAKVVRDYASGIATLTDAFRESLPILNLLAKTIGSLSDLPGGGFLIGGIPGMIGEIKRRIKGGGPVFDPNQNTRAVQPPGIANRSEEVYNPAALAALQASSGTEKKKTVQDEQLSIQTQILEFLNNKWGGVAVGQGGGGIGMQAGQAAGGGIGHVGAAGVGGIGMGLGMLGGSGVNIAQRIGRGIAESIFTR